MAARPWPPRRPGRPLALAHGRGGARERLSHRPAALRHRARGRLPAAREGADDLHRQPGRAALGARPHRPRASIPQVALGARRHGRSSPRASFPGNERSDRRAAERAGAARRRGRHRDATTSSMSPAIRRATSWSRCTSGCGRASPCRCMARRAIWRRMPGWPRAARCRRRWSIENGDVVRLAPGPAPRSSSDVPAGRLGLDGNGLVPLDGTVMRSAIASCWNGAAVATLVLDKRRATCRPSRRSRVQGLLDPERTTEISTSCRAAVRAAVERAVRRRPRRRRHRQGGRPPRRAPRRSTPATARSR